jgi:hypothetical protein
VVRVPRRLPAVPALWLLAAATVVFCPSPAAGYDAQVDASVDAQFYTYRSPFGDPVVRRRRYTQTLALAVHDIGGGSPDPHAPQLSFRARMRLDGDFGQSGAERDPESPGRFIPELEQAPVDVMYAYLEGKNLAGGLLGFRAGRQYVTDALGWWSFDGALVRVTTPIFLQLEAHGGFEQRGGLPLSTSRFEADGVFRGDRSQYDADLWPSFLEQTALAPAWGVALESAGVHWIHGRLSYRRVINRDTVYVSPFADASSGYATLGGDRISSERLGYALRADSARLGAAKGSIVYDFYNQRISDWAAGLDWYGPREITLGADWEYYLPTFDADSIWNWFTHNGTTTILGRARWKASRSFEVGASGGSRIYKTDGDPETYAAWTQYAEGPGPDRDSIKQLTDRLGTLSGTYRWADGSVGLRAMGETGDRGHRMGGDLTTLKTFDERRWDTTLVLSVYDWEDGLRPQRDATSFSYVVGGGMSPLERTRLGVEFEHAMNRLVGQRYRVLATLDLSVLW